MYDLSASLLGHLIGYPIIVTTRAIQKRRHHKWRINKKWAKRYGFIYYEIQEAPVLFLDEKYYVTRKGFDLLVSMAEREENKTWEQEQKIKDLKNCEKKDTKSIQSRVSTLFNNVHTRLISIT